MKQFLLAIPLLFLTACVDTTGLSKESSRTVAGNPNAHVTVTEYFDLECPACQSAHVGIAKPLLEEYGDDIAYEAKHFPIRTAHPHALDAAMAAECAADQGKFWEYIDYVFLHQKEMKKDIFTEWAATLQLDTELFTRCLESEIKRDTVLDDYAEGRENGVNGTPSFFVNGERVKAYVRGEEQVSLLDALKEAIEKGKKAGEEMPL